MTANSLKLSLLSLPDEPHHPNNFEFPKRTFGKPNLTPRRASGLIASELAVPAVLYVFDEQEALSMHVTCHW